MLNFLEQTALYNSANFSWAAGGGGTTPAYNVNSTTYNTKLLAFLCPSDPNAGVNNINSYHASTGTTTNTFDNCCQQSTGLFTNQITYSIAQVPDGTSTTVAFSEALVGDIQAVAARRGNGTGVSSTGSATWQMDISAVALTTLQADWATCSQAQATQVNTDRGTRWAWGTLGCSLFNTVLPPNGGAYVTWNACRMGNPGTVTNGQYENASSAHSGGANTLFGDGSVKFIKSTIGLQTWWALGTRANGEAISGDAY